MASFGIAVALLLAFSAQPNPPAVAAEAVGDELLGSNPHALYLAAGTIDLATAPSLLDNLNAHITPDAYYVIQLDGPMTRDRRAAITDTGLELLDYIPMNAYIVRGATINVAAIRGLSFVRWLGEYRPQWRISPEIPKVRAYQDADRRAMNDRGEKRLAVSLMRGADLTRAARVIEQQALAINEVLPAPDRCKLEFDIGSDKIESLTDIPDVLFIAEAPEGEPRNSATTWVIQSDIPGSTPLWNAGLHGEGQIIGLIDWGLDEAHCAFDDLVAPGPAHRKLLAYVVANGQVIPGGFGYHGTHAGCTLAGDDLSGTSANFRGMAYKSRIVMQHYSGLVTATNVDERLQFAYDLGARVHSNSWGSSTDTTYNAWCADIDQFSHDYEENLVLVAIMNGGSASLPGSIRSPENAKNCLAVAAANEPPNQNNHGSGARGPTTDGRQKPEVWVSGCPTSANVSTACAEIDRTCATSWATPAMSAFATLTRQYFIDGFYPGGAANALDAFEPSGALIKAVILNSAVDMSGFAGYLGTHEGWGRAIMDGALYFAGDDRKLVVHDVRHVDGLATGETQRFYVNVLSSTQRLKVTLVWSDAPASVAAAFTPVNNLNLVVTDPSDVSYTGNSFEGVESVPGGPADSLNNTEQVHLSNPATGVWAIDVVGAAVNVGTQGFALAITGDLQQSICIKGDVNGDGLVDGGDIAAFVSVLLDGGSFVERCAADIDESGVADHFDVGPFAALLIGVAYCPRIKGDMNNDGFVDAGDIQGFTNVLTNGGTPDEICAADFDYSNIADLDDLSAFLSQLTDIE